MTYAEKNMKIQQICTKLPAFQFWSRRGLLSLSRKTTICMKPHEATMALVRDVSIQRRYSLSLSNQKYSITYNFVT